MKQHEILIIGGGPGGSTLGAFLAIKGYDVGLFEKETFPRFRIGESLLPCSMDVFKESGVYPTLDSGKYIRKYGAQFIDHRTEKEVYFNFGDTSDPGQGMAFEVPRADFDLDLLDHAKKMGCTVYQPVRVDKIELQPDSVTLETDAGTFQGAYLADASGRLSVTGHQFKMRHPNPDLNNVGVFAHFTGIKRKPGIRAGDIIIGLLPGGAWSWIIPFQGEKTSMGVVTASNKVDRDQNFDQYIENSVRCCPIFQDILQNVKRVTDIQMVSNYSATCESFFGDRWIAVGDAATFLDPIFSSGVHISVSSARFASKVIDTAFTKKMLLTQQNLGADYEKQLRLGVKRFHSIIRRFYDTSFVEDMSKVLTLPHLRKAFTAIVAGDVWNDDNVAFKMGAVQ